MQTRRLTTPATILLAVVAAVLIGTAAVRFLQREPAMLDIPAAPTAGPQTALGSFNPALVYQARVDGVITVDAVFGESRIGGSGFVVDADGHILTSSHVVIDYAGGNAQPSAVYVEFNSRDRVQARVLGVDQFNDLAVLQVDPAHVTKLRPLPLGNSDKVIVGEPVAAIGAPFGSQESLSTGIVSKTRNVVGSQINRASSIADAIQTDVQINRGNSGGPLFNARGQVIGINQQIRTTSGVSEGVAFAVPVNTAKRALEQIVRDGRVRYAWLGLSTATVTPQLARSYSLKAPYGAVVSRSEGPAQRAGVSSVGQTVVYMGEEIHLGDHVVAIAGEKVVSKEDINRVANRLDPGRPVEVELFRGGARQVVTLVPEEKAIT